MEKRYEPCTETNFSRQIVYFGHACFAELLRLEHLSIHVSFGRFVNGSFYGLNEVEILDLSNLDNMVESDLRLFFANDAFPNINTMIMYNAGTTHSSLALNDYFWQMMFERSVPYIDISSPGIKTNVSAMCRYCDNIETLNMTRTTVFSTSACNVNHARS